MIKAILFDFGGVILNLKKKPSINIPQSLSALFEISLKKANSLWQENKEKVCVGKETPQQFLSRMKKITGSRQAVNKLYKKWEIMNLKEKDLIDWKLLAYIQNLRNKFKVYILSNTIDIAQNDSLSKKIYSFFDGCFLSCKEGYKKPDKEAFFNALNKIKVKPEEVVLIDDTQANILAAKKLGIKSFLYQGLSRLKKDLKSINL